MSEKQAGVGGSGKTVLHVDVLSPQLPKLAGVLKDLGYSTIAFQTNMQLHPESGFAEGFDRYDYLGNVPASTVSQQAVSTIETAQEPFFLYVHYMDPHIPYAPPRNILSKLGEFFSVIFPSPHLTALFYPNGLDFREVRTVDANFNLMRRFCRHMGLEKRSNDMGGDSTTNQAWRR